MSKLSKEETRYGRGHTDSHCGPVLARDKSYCKHFIAVGKSSLDKGKCELVEGEINPIYWCNRWKRAEPKR